LENDVTVPIRQWRTIILPTPLNVYNKTPYGTFHRATMEFDGYDIKIKHFVNLKTGGARPSPPKD